MAKKAAPVLRDPKGHAKALADLLNSNARRHRLHQVFSDFCEMAAISMSNAVDLAHREKREQRYMTMIGRYDSAEIDRFPQLLGVLVDWLSVDMRDCLGSLFMALDLGNAETGQFFTPYEVSRLMAGMILGDPSDIIERDGFIALQEPAVGAGGMVIAVADALAEKGINYQQSMHVTAIDVDPTAVHMAYLQCSLLHIPAIIIHGNSLSLQEWDHWVTPAHVLGGWDRRLRMRDALERFQQFTVPEKAAPMPAAAPGRSFETSPAAPDLGEIRRAVVTQRIEQMDLFG